MAKTSMTRSEAYDLIGRLRTQIETAIFGQTDLIQEALSCFLAGGHILMTGAPGLAKTTLVRVFASHLGIDFGRIQFTPDLLPSDIVGADILNVDSSSGRRHFEFSKGPIFTNLLLADEINRASPRAQSALLEAMQERSSTVGGAKHVLPKPFMVFATQNPYESEGTFPLPEAQLDRFLLHSYVRFPTEEAEKRILHEHAANHLVGENWDNQKEGLSLDEDMVDSLIQTASDMLIDPELIDAICRIVRATRPESDDCPSEFRDGIWYGAGPRAGIAMISVSKAYSLVLGSDTVRWKHVKRMIKPVLRHRMKLNSQGLRKYNSEDAIIEEIIDRIEANARNLNTQE